MFFVKALAVSTWALTTSTKGQCQGPCTPVSAHVHKGIDPLSFYTSQIQDF